uniref:Uncharacterized protein n=1 Tax=Steinernema glaseri TaxID=37863 RepID=A0A1I7XZM8_9BILA
MLHPFNPLSIWPMPSPRCVLLLSLLLVAVFPSQQVPNSLHHRIANNYRMKFFRNIPPSELLPRSLRMYGDPQEMPYWTPQDRSFQSNGDS